MKAEAYSGRAFLRDEVKAGQLALAVLARDQRSRQREREKDAQLDAAVDEVDRLGRAEERAEDRVLLGQVGAEALPLARVAHAPAPGVADMAVVGGALQLLEHRAAGAQARQERVVLERDDAAREDADARVRAERHGAVAAAHEYLDVRRDGALLGGAEARERDAKNRVDAARALVDDERDAVLAVARLELARDR